MKHESKEDISEIIIIRTPRKIGVLLCSCLQTAVTCKNPVVQEFTREHF